MLTMDTLKRFPIAIFCALTVLLSFASYLTTVPREALPFVFVLIPTLVAIALVAVTEGKVSVRALLGQLGRWRVSIRWVAGALALALADRQTVVTAFGRKKFNLEEIFLEMVDGGN